MSALAGVAGLDTRVAHTAKSARSEAAGYTNHYRRVAYGTYTAP